jgi:WD40 repeat protein
MVMAIRLVFAPNSSKAKPQLLILAGYEGGNVCVWSQPTSPSTTSTPHFQLVYSAKAHAQPVLSLDVALSQGTFYSSSADAIIARHPLLPISALSETKTVQTKHAGQQGLSVRSDGKIFATAGWDGRVRVYSVKTMKELAVLKWHGEGCYAVSFAEVVDEGGDSKQEVSAGELAKRALTVAQRREEKARTTHWLAAGSKDGKVSLWEIY